MPDSTLRYTLISDGSSDQALLPILNWLLREHGIRSAIDPVWADLRQLPRPPKKLVEKILRGIDLYPCDLLFIHRDAENQTRQRRVEEIQQAVRQAVRTVNLFPPQICVIPVRMQEAWLLFDEEAIRRSAGNPDGNQSLELPDFAHIESLADPKSALHDLLKQASGLTGRKLKQFPVNRRVYRLVQEVEDFSALRQLSAFQALEADLRTLIEAQGWNRL
jgi:hypothetical protein